MREKRENVEEEARRWYEAFVATYSSSSTRIEHRLVQAAIDCAPSIEVPVIFDVKQSMEHR